jgi:hypothetical protein
MPASQQYIAGSATAKPAAGWFASQLQERAAASDRERRFAFLARKDDPAALRTRVWQKRVADPEVRSDVTSAPAAGSTMRIPPQDSRADGCSNFWRRVAFLPNGLLVAGSCCNPMTRSNRIRLIGRAKVLDQLN